MKTRSWLVIAGAIGVMAFGALAIPFIMAHATPMLQTPDAQVGIDVAPTGAEVLGSWTRVTTADRFQLRVPSRAPEVRGLIETARTAGHSVEFQVAQNGAHFDADNGMPTLWASALSYGDQSLGPYELPRFWSWRVLTDEQAAVLKAAFSAARGQNGPALVELNRSLRTDALRGAQRGLALAMRADVYRRKIPEESGEQGRDYLLMRASEDYAAAARLRGNEPALILAQAEALASLGADEEAITLLRPVVARAAGDNFAAAIKAAELLRIRKRYAEALQVLDQQGRRPIPAARNPVYQYQRARTLLLLERPQEAAAAFSAVLAGRPQWYWAHLGRACARLSIRDADGALADLRAARDLATDDKSRATEYLGILLAELRLNERQLLAAGADAPATISVCERFQPDFNGPPRARSRVLERAQPSD